MCECLSGKGSQEVKNSSVLVFFKFCLCAHFAQDGLIFILMHVKCIAVVCRKYF